MLLSFLLLPFLGSLAFLLLPRKSLPASAPWALTLGVTGLCLCLLVALTLGFDPESPISLFAPWIPEMGLNFSLWLDGPALFYCWLVCGIGFLIFLYSGFYMDPTDSPWRFYGMMLFFMGSMLGVVMSRNALLMLVFWELTSISSFILIGHWHHKDTARQGALRALIVTGAGGLCLMTGLAGLFWIMRGAGVDPAMALEWDVLWANRALVLEHPLVGAVLALVLIGAFTKSAQFPFHFWLPGAMEAPTPVSAFLHAATMVKAGIYLLGRLYPLFGEMEAWLIVVGSTGVITMGIAGFMALTARDLKQLLAFSTVSQLGLLTAYYGFGHGHAGTDSMLKLDLLLVASHAMFKGALFMIVGVIDHAAHTREWTRLGGLRKSMPVTTVLTIAGCISMAGLPLTFGFVAKELFLKAAFDLNGSIAWLNHALAAGAVLTSLFTSAYCWRMAVSPFFGKPRDPSIHPHEGGLGLLFSPALLIILCVLGGLYVPLLEKPIAATTNAAFYATYSTFTVGFFHHVDKLLWIAIFLTVVGFAIFLGAEKLLLRYEKMGSPAPFRAVYTAIFDDFVPSFAGWLARTMQSPSLQKNVTRSFAFSFVLILGAIIFSRHEFSISYEFAPRDLVVLATVLLSIPCLLVIMFHEVLLVRLAAMAPIGIFVAAFFVFYKAPDLALTQVLIEVSLLLLLLLVIFHLPQKVSRGSRDPMVGGRVGIALLGGLLMAFLTLTGAESPFRERGTFPGSPALHDYQLQNAKYPIFKGNEEAAISAGYPGAENLRSGGGNNVVNVILVDYRGIDTMGEILVLGIAAIGVVCLLQIARREDWHQPITSAQSKTEVEKLSEVGAGMIVKDDAFRGSLGPSLLLAQLARIVPAFVLVFAVVLFFAGHNKPGGGFIAGLLAAVGTLILFIAFRSMEIRNLTEANYMKLIPIGLTFAVLTGLASIVFGAPFLTSAFAYLPIPFFGPFEIASAVSFDLGVFLVVFGAAMVILGTLGKE